MAEKDAMIEKEKKAYEFLNKKSLDELYKLLEKTNNTPCFVPVFDSTYYRDKEDYETQWRESLIKMMVPKIEFECK